MPQESAPLSAATPPRAGPPPGPRGRRLGRWVLLLALLVWAVTGGYYASRSLPAGIRVAGLWSDVPAADVRFLRDLTAADAYGRPIVDQQIFDRALALIGHAQRFIVLDFFLVEDPEGAPPAYRPLAAELEAALLARKRAVPGLEVLFVTDPINEVYGSEPSPAFARLRAAGVDVVITDLDRLPDSNPAWSGLWRLLVRWWQPAPHGPGILPGFGAWARLLNFKANHRRVLIADDGAAGLAGIVASADPHAPSSRHSNVALALNGTVLEPLLASELAIARASGWRGGLPGGGDGAAAASAPLPDAERGFLEGRVLRVRVLTEGAIRGALLERIDAAARGERIDVAMFQLADRDVIEALLAAAARGVAVRALLDPNKDAFGRDASGLPNRQAASELVAASDGAIKVRWYRTHGEQFHTKLVAVYGTDRLWLTLGSANLTRRTLGDFDLEANLALEASRRAALAEEVLRWFDTLWNNQAAAGVEYSAPYDVYFDPSQGRYWLYRFMEGTGVASF